MSLKKQLHPRTWVEISTSAVQKNHDTFRALTGGDTQLWAVVKSNAYGHGIFSFPHIADKAGYDGFCVDSLSEGVALREQGIAKPILVIGPTPAEDVSVAAEADITLSAATVQDIEAIARAERTPEFHIKIDTGFHRRGIYPENLPAVIEKLKHVSGGNGHMSNVVPTGVYTHFSSAKDMNYPSYTDRQFERFTEACETLENAGCSDLTRHCAATSATIIGKKYHMDAVRVGIGLYGLWPSTELEIQRDDIALAPALSWRTRVSEVKSVAGGEYIGYNLAERLPRDGTIAVLPVGYWYGLPRNLSHIGEVLIRGKRARILGKISMDLTVVDVTGIPCETGDIATIIGRDGDEEIHAHDVALALHTIHYEVVTRINPLIERRIVG